ncbi:hypothetical protein [Robbsia sp. KACC 23696]|uniref:hypothetical protein n=1 Tax=Robbsia sp. KACC 23696 TaxID=3149231 RepID=UPI00325BFE65
MSVARFGEGRLTPSRRMTLSCCALLFLTGSMLTSAASAQTPGNQPSVATPRVAPISPSSTTTRQAGSAQPTAVTTNGSVASHANDANALASEGGSSEDLTSDAPCH